MLNIFCQRAQYGNILLAQAFFLTPAAEKTKTQAENSSQKLKEKTQPQGGTFLLLRETQGKKFMVYNFLSNFC